MDNWLLISGGTVVEAAAATAVTKHLRSTVESASAEVLAESAATEADRERSPLLNSGGTGSNSSPGDAAE
jgi:hypothetical protein